MAKTDRTVLCTASVSNLFIQFGSFALSTCFGNSKHFWLYRNLFAIKKPIKRSTTSSRVLKKTTSERPGEMLEQVRWTSRRLCSKTRYDTTIRLLSFTSNQVTYRNNLVSRPMLYVITPGYIITILTIQVYNTLFWIDCTLRGCLCSSLYCISRCCLFCDVVGPSF